MQETFWDKFVNEHFVLFNVIYSLLQAGLYTIKGFQDGFLIGTNIVVLMNLLIIPLLFIFKKKGFSIFYLIYSILIVFVLASEKTFLFNNYSALFLVCIVFMIQPKLRLTSTILYFAAVCATFLIYDEPVLYFFIHLIRSFWFIQIVAYVLNNKFERKRLVLYEDEMKILDQLCAKNIYQKEVEGFSENTIYRKLKAARERNGNLTREQLIELYKHEKEKQAKLMQQQD